MRAVFLVLTTVYVSTGELVTEPAAVRFRGVSLMECAALLEREKFHPFQEDKPDGDTLKRMVVHFLSEKAWIIEEEWARAGESVDVTVSCEEREVEPDPWETPE